MSLEELRKVQSKMQNIAERWEGQNSGNGLYSISCVRYDDKHNCIFYSVVPSTSGVTVIRAVDAKYIENDSSLEEDGKKYFVEKKEREAEHYKNSFCKECNQKKPKVSYPYQTAFCDF